MPKDLLLNKLVRKHLLAATVVVAVVTAGLLTSNGYCEAFSAAPKFERIAQFPSPSMRAVGRKSSDSGVMRSMKRGATLNLIAESSDETMATPTASQDEHETEQAIVTVEENSDNEEQNENHPPFDKVAWETYKTSMEEILTQPRVIRNSHEETIAKCRAFLLSYENYLTPVPDIVEIVGKNHENRKETLETALEERHRLFRERFDFTDEQVQFVSRCLVYIGDTCAREQSRQIRNAKNDKNSDNQLDPRLSIVVVWHKIKDLGLVVREKSVSSYMYILSSTRGNDGNCEENMEGNSALIDDSLLEVVSCYDAIYGSSEKTVTIRLKGLIARGKIDEAEEMFAASFEDSCGVNSESPDSSTEGRDNIKGRLRTYMPLMEYYCSVGDLKSTLRLYRQMQNCSGVHWDVESYTILLSSLAKFGYFFGDKQQVGEREDLGDDDDLYGPKLFDFLVSDMANDILELTEATSIELFDAFQQGMKDHVEENSITADQNEDQSLSKTTESSKTVVVDRVEISKDNGTCPATDVKLRLLALDNIQRQHVHDTLLEMSKKNTEEFLTSNIKWQEANKDTNPATKGNIEIMTSKLEESYGYQELRKFSEWLDEREGNLFTTIVDGANVAYYGHSNVHYSSLKKVVEKLESMGERPLVVMPEKYTWKKFSVRPKYYQKLTEKDQEVIQWLREKEIMYIVPRYVLDDYFWMLASVSNQTNATQRGDLSIPVGDDQGRFPGMRPMLITNDQMRDHKLDLLEPREFRRWCSCHIVNYDIGEYVEDEWEEDRQISLVPADSFSREIQPNKHRTGNGNVWHFPIGDSSDWLCIWIEA